MRAAGGSAARVKVLSRVDAGEGAQKLNTCKSKSISCFYERSSYSLASARCVALALFLGVFPDPAPCFSRLYNEALPLLSKMTNERRPEIIISGLIARIDFLLI